MLKQRDGKKFGIDRMALYNLNGELELDDTVTPLYRKSLLYLVSNAFEETHGGFDNDVDTMNDVLHSVLRLAPGREFTKKDLKY